MFVAGRIQGRKNSFGANGVGWWPVDKHKESDQDDGKGEETRLSPLEELREVPGEIHKKVANFEVTHERRREQGEMP